LPLKKISETFDVPIKSLKRWLIVGAERKKGNKSFLNFYNIFIFKYVKFFDAFSLSFKVIIFRF